VKGQEWLEKKNDKTKEKAKIITQKVTSLY